MIFGLLRVKNEARWIERVIHSISGLCSQVLVFDDHSTDDTRQIALHAGAIVLSSPFEETVDESRDKDYLLDSVFEFGHASVGDWAVMIDGDEELAAGDGQLIEQAIRKQRRCDVFSLKILYLWNSSDLVRVDGVYGNFRRASAFRLTSRELRFQRTRYGGHFHCGNVPSQLLGSACGNLDARLLHWGYVDEELRRRKFEFYNRIDPNNQSEDFYRHITQGDAGGVSACASLRHAGPLRLARV